MASTHSALHTCRDLKAKPRPCYRHHTCMDPKVKPRTCNRHQAPVLKLPNLLLLLSPHQSNRSSAHTRRPVTPAITIMHTHPPALTSMHSQPSTITPKHNNCNHTLSHFHNRSNNLQTPHIIQHPQHSTPKTFSTLPFSHRTFTEHHHLPQLRRRHHPTPRTPRQQ